MKLRALIPYVNIFLLLIGSAIPAHAQDGEGTLPQFAFPVDCTLNEDCWIINYVDTDPHPKSARDFMCSNKTYEGHKGTDFALRSRIEMEEGVNVLAARDGTILRLRDGESDTPKTEDEYQAIRDANKDCGNGIILDHGNGLQSFYCHLKKGSINVKPGDEVKQGDPIAQIGQSGFSEFPHLHLTIIWEGGHIDPFTGHLMSDGCAKFKENMWEPDIPYTPYSVYDGGFSDSVPDFKTIEAGQNHPETLSADSNALVYWASFYHATEGDKITLTITDPSGDVFARREHTLKNSRKRPSFYYTGRKLNGKRLEPGIYTGQITYEKGKHSPKTFTHKIEIK